MSVRLLSSASRLFGVSATVLLAAYCVGIAPQEALAQGCAMCQTLLSGANEQVMQGMLRSAFFLMTMPFVVFGLIGGWIFYRYWKTNRSHRAEGTMQPFQVLSAPKEEQP